MKDNFSKQSSLYAQFRPLYPAALFKYITAFITEKKTAWDCGTGNGQCAVSLSASFEKVFATDISARQIEQAQKTLNIFYSVQPAEHTDIAHNSINLVTVAQALHWFKPDEFYAEVKRVAANDSFIAAWCYSLLRISKPVNDIIDTYHFDTMAPCWDAERKYVDEGYRNIPFPFEKINTPAFAIETYWTIEELEGYLNTWSALQQYLSIHHYSPVPEVINKIKPHWHGNKQKIIFPIHLLLGSIK